MPASAQAPQSQNPMLPELGGRPRSEHRFQAPSGSDDGAVSLPGCLDTNGRTAFDRLHRWATSSPDPWEELSAADQEGLIGLRVPLNKQGIVGKGSMEWGALGHLGLHVPGTLFGSTPTVNSYRQKLAWGDLSRTVPQSLLEHESVAGVSDGWVLLAGIYSQCTNEENNKNLVNLWSERLLKGVPEEDRHRQWRLCMLKAAGVLLEQSDVGDDLRRHEVLVYRLTSPGRCILGWHGDEAVQPELRRELSTILVSTRAFRRTLVSDQGNAETLLRDGLKTPRTEDQASSRLWEGVLGLYHEIGRLAASGAHESFGSDQSFLEKTMCDWVGQGFLPTDLQEDAAHGTLALLAKRQPDLHRALMVVQSTRMADRLEQCLDAAAAARPRPRM